MAAPNVPKMIEKIEIHRLPVNLLAEILPILKKGERTGSLTIHFNQGNATGYMEWKQKCS